MIARLLRWLLSLVELDKVKKPEKSKDEFRRVEGNLNELMRAARRNKRAGSGLRRREVIAEKEYRRYGKVPCYGCEEDMLPSNSTIEHIRPVAKGGDWNISNLALSHQRCNILKKDKLLPRGFNRGGVYDRDKQEDNIKEGNQQVHIHIPAK